MCIDPSYALLLGGEEERWSTMLKFDVMVDSNYPFPSPDWITSNASWAAEQLAVYYANRTGS